MTRFFLKYLMCPNCHEPFLTRNELKHLSDDYYLCETCKARFSKYIDFTGLEDELVTSLSEVFHFDFKSSKLKAKKHEYWWEILLNSIEKSYLKWIIDDEPEGLYLITWPWREVKFVPALVHMLNKELGLKIVVVKDYYKNVDSSQLLNKMAFLPSSTHDAPSIRIPNKIWKALMKYVKQNIYLPSKEVCVIVNFKGKKTTINYSIRGSSKRTIDKEFKKRFREEYGIDYIDVLNFKCVENQIKYPLHYDLRWSLEVIRECQNLEIPSEKILDVDEKAFKFFSDLNQLPVADLYFVSGKIPLDWIFKFILKVNADVVIFENFDLFISTNIGYKSSLISPLESLFNQKKLVLLFSTQPDLRYQYKLHTDNPLIPLATVHTWDNPSVLNVVVSDWLESKYLNPLSNKKSELPSNKKIEYLTYTVDSLKPIRDFMDLIVRLDLDDILKGEIKFYFKHLVKSPLYVFGDFSNLKVFTRSFKGRDLTISFLLDGLCRYDYALSEKATSLLQSVYGTPTNPKNPILDYILKYIKVGIKNHATVLVVVHPEDVLGTRQILKEILSPEEQKHVYITSWAKFALKKIKNAVNIVLITTQSLPINFYLYSNRISIVYFIGDTKNVELFRKSIAFRFDEMNRRPLSIPDETNKYPKLLTDVFDCLDVTKSDIEDYKRESIIEFSTPFGIEKTLTSSSFVSTMIDAGDEALLLIDKTQRGIFLPFGRYLIIRKKIDQQITEIRITKDLDVKLLQNSEVIINKQGIYVSYKYIFLEKLLSHPHPIEVNNPPFHWDSFRDLVVDAYSWCENLLKTKEWLVRSKKISDEEASVLLATSLSKAHIYASNIDYIQNWWEIEETIKIEDDTIHIFPVERPKGSKDILEIYKVIKNLFPQFNFEEIDAYRAYVAAHTLQKLRHMFLKGDKNKIPVELRGLYEELKQSIDLLIDDSDLVEPFLIKRVKVHNTVPAFEPIIDYAKYCIEY